MHYYAVAENQHTKGIAKTPQPNTTEVQNHHAAAMIILALFLSTFVSITFTIIWCYPLMKEHEQLQNQVIMLHSHISSGCNATKQIPYPTPVDNTKDHENFLPFTTDYKITETLLLQNYKVAPAIIVMDDYTEKLKTKEKWSSEPFFAFERGYLMYLSVYPGGHDDGEGSHVSVYLHLMKGPYDDELEQSGYWPMRGTFTIDLLNVHYIHRYSFTLNYFLCELCTFRVRIGDEAPSGWGYPKYISHQFLPVYNLFDSLYFEIFYSNRPEEALAINDIIFQKILNLMVQFLISLSNLWPIIVFPFAIDILLKYDVVYCMQTVFPLVSILKGPIISLMAMEILLAGDLMLMMVVDYGNVDDNVSAPIHCILIRLAVVSLWLYIGSIFDIIVILFVP